MQLVLHSKDLFFHENLKLQLYLFYFYPLSISIKV